MERSSCCVWAFAAGVVVALLAGFGALRWESMAAAVGVWQPLHGERVAPPRRAAPAVASPLPPPLAPGEALASEAARLAALDDAAWEAERAADEAAVAAAQAAVLGQGLCDGCCAGVLAALRDPTDGAEARHGWYHRYLGCARLRPGEGAEVYELSPDTPPHYTNYWNAARIFLADVALRLHHLGEALVVVEDDATLPPSVIRAACAAGVPLLAHSIHRDAREEAILIPDWHFIESRGFKSVVREVNRVELLMRERKPVVFWRGSTTGYPHMCRPKVGVDDASRLIECNLNCEGVERYQLVHRAKGMGWVDAKISNGVQWCGGDVEAMRGEGLMGEPRSEPGWVEHRGILDIDGNVNAWGNAWRMASGSVVFKVEGPYTNMYMEAAKPGVHYVSIHGNLSNLEEATRVVTDDAQVPRLERIAASAQELMTPFTYGESVRRVAGELDTVFGGGGACGEGASCCPSRALAKLASAESWTERETGWWRRVASPHG